MIDSEAKIPRMSQIMRVYSDPEYQSTPVQNVLFVPGIEHDNRDLAALQDIVRGRIKFIMVEKSDVPFDPKRRKDWEMHFRAHLLNIAKEYNVKGIVGHSFGCFRSIHLLQEGLHVDFVILLNPPLTTIGNTFDDPDNNYGKMALGKNKITTTHTENRLFPLVLELDDPLYLDFMTHHTEPERQTGEPFQPTQITEFKTLSSSPDFADVLRSNMHNLGYPTLPVIIYRSLCDKWDIKNWGELPPNIRFKIFKDAGHYLHMKYAADIGNDLVAGLQPLDTSEIFAEEVMRLIAEDPAAKFEKAVS